MNSKTKKRLIIFLIIFVIINIIHALFLILIQIDDYKPNLIEKSILLNNTSTTKKIDDLKEIKLLTWNIGSGILDKNYSFNPFKKNNNRENNLIGIQNFLNSTGYDVILMQETGFNFARQFSSKSNYHFNFIYNLKIKKIDLGMLTLSRFQTDSSIRYALPGKHFWPMRMFTFKRAILENRYKFKNKQLIIINIHLEFIDKKNKIKTQELQYIKNKILEEYEKGNYIILGGDWNFILPGVDKNKFYPWNTPSYFVNQLNNFFKDWTPPGWKWAYPENTPTIRSTDKPYQKGKNFTTIIDGFLLSPNIKMKDIHEFDMDFKYSDHQPVGIIIELERIAN